MNLIFQSQQCILFFKKHLGLHEWKPTNIHFLSHDDLERHTTVCEAILLAYLNDPEFTSNRIKECCLVIYVVI